MSDRDIRVSAGGVHPVAAQVECNAWREILGVAAAADAMRCLENDKMKAEVARRLRGGDSSGTSSNDRYVVDGPLQLLACRSLPDVTAYLNRARARGSI